MCMRMRPRYIPSPSPSQCRYNVYRPRTPALLMYPPTDQFHSFLPHVFHTFHAMPFTALDWCPAAYADKDKQVFTAVPAHVLATMMELEHVILSDIQVRAGGERAWMFE
jgi:hypothetical protein